VEFPHPSKKSKKEESMVAKANLSKSIIVGALVLVGCVLMVSFSTRTVSGRNSDDSAGSIARGAGTTIIHGGTGSPDFVPVITTVAFHAENSAAGITGEFDCLAFAPEAKTGPQSGQLTVNAMYVAGKITGAAVQGDTATLTGTARITGLGVGTDVPFTFVVHSGGPGAAANLSVNTLTFPFNEILVQGAFEVHD
jgi:hypothetical protein